MITLEQKQKIVINYLIEKGIDFSMKDSCMTYANITILSCYDNEQLEQLCKYGFIYSFDKGFYIEITDIIIKNGKN